MTSVFLSRHIRSFKTSLKFRLVLGWVAAMAGLLFIGPVLIIGAPFLLVSLLTRRLASHWEPRHRSWNDFIEFKPTVGWQPKPNVRAYHLSDDVYYTSTDENGWRGRVRLPDSDVVVLGDSFVWGYGIDDTHFFADLDQSIRMKAIGACGYSMVQEYLWMKCLGPQLTGKLVVWCIYLGNDLYDNLVPNLGKYRRPWVRQKNSDGEWVIETSHVNPTGWPSAFEHHVDGIDYYQKLADLCSKTVLAGRAYSACSWLLQQGFATCRAQDARLAVITIPEVSQLSEDGTRFLLSRGGDPQSFNAGYPDEQIGRLCQELDIPFIAGKDHFRVRHYRKRDCHWNESGHRQFLEIINNLSTDAQHDGISNSERRNLVGS
jgi:hypothetical protein